MQKFDAAIIATTIIWAAIMVASAIILEGTSYFSQMLPILSGGAATSIVVLGASRPKKNEY